MDLETASRIQAQIRSIEDRLRELEPDQNVGEMLPDDSARTEIAELYEERELLIQELALAAWNKTA